MDDPVGSDLREPVDCRIVSPEMENEQSIWLVRNEASGSNDERALADLRAALDEAGLALCGETDFPKHEPPTRNELRSHGAGILAVFAGDGTISHIVSRLFGWDGAILPLPGGTMNLLCRKLHGASRPEEIIARLRAGAARKVRPAILQSQCGPALTGALVGPGTAWNDVREAMRDADVGGMAAATREAIAESFTSSPVVCNEFPDARAGGYVAISLVPTESGIDVSGYYAEDAGDVARQTIALLSGDFREGPHDFLGSLPEAEIVSPSGELMGLMLDGEPCNAGASVRFTLARCEVDLLATAATA